MSKFIIFLGLFVVSCLHVRETESARITAEKVSAHRQLGRVVLSEQQQQLRKASQAAEASLVCGSTEIKSEIRKAKDVNAVQDIPWDSIQKTAKAGLGDIEKHMQTLETEKKELEQKYQELLAANQWKEVPVSDIDEMLTAVCRIKDFANQAENCDRAAEFSCGYTDESFYEADPMIDIPYDEPVAVFREIALKKIVKQTRLPVKTFRKRCADILKTTDGEEGCDDLCSEFASIVSELSNSEEGAINLAESDTMDSVHKKLDATKQALVNAAAEKSLCEEANTKIDEFGTQLLKLGLGVQVSQKAVGKFKRILNKEKRTLKKQIIELKKRLAELEKAKVIFAAAEQNVKERKEDVDRVEQALKALTKALEEQEKKIRILEEKIVDIEAATKTGMLFKDQLSLTLLAAVEVNTEAFHQPLEMVGVTPGRNIAQEFSKAEAASVEAMKGTVSAVEEFCKERVSALTAVQDQLEDASHQLSHICTGQDWNNMIVEAQGVVKQDAKDVIEILEEEQNGVRADNEFSVQTSLKVRTTHGEPKGLRHAVAVYGGQSGHFINEYLTPGWAVEGGKGKDADIGKMLMLYQKLGEAFELTQKDHKEATEGADQLKVKIHEAVKELKKLYEVLKKAIADKEIAESNMGAAQELVKSAEETKKALELSVASKEIETAEGQKAFTEAGAALMSEHKQREEALLEVLQELQR